MAARALGENRNYRGAVTRLRGVLADHPESVAAHYLLGLFLYNMDANTEALEACRAAVALDPEDAVAHRLLGIVLGHSPRRRKTGLKHLEQAVALAPHDGYNHYFHARLLAASGRRRAAKASYDRACERAPADPVVLAGTAEFLFGARRSTEARALAERAFAADGDHHMALAAMARACLHEGRFVEARDFARAAVAGHSTYRPGIEALIEAEMCRNPLFRAWSRLKSWRQGRPWRAILFATLFWSLVVCSGVTLAVVFPATADTLPWLFVGLSLCLTVPKIVYRKRVEAALTPFRLRRRF